jgi:hypothetical protein
VADSAELVLRPGLIRWAWAIGLATFLALVGGFGLRTDWPLAWPFLGGAALLFGFTAWVMLAPRMRLRLSSEGFAYGTVRRRYFFRWSDVAGFEVSPFAGHQWVVFTFVPGYCGDERVRAINQEFARFDRFLPDTYGMRAVALAQLLESWRLRHTDPAQQGISADGPGD